jgi:radical SAM superfamily enzyme YgiQ (UPF0313 family)
MIFDFASEALSEPVRLSLRAESTSMALGTDRILSFDGAGRLLTAYADGRLCRRGLDNRIMEKWRSWTVGQSERIRRDLTGDEKDNLIADVQATLAQVLPELPVEAPAEVRRRLEKMALWNRAAYAAESQRFLSVYKPVAILPPDQYLSLVLQATEGCHYNQCTFCEFYRHQPFRIKDEVEFREHIQAARAFLGEGMALRRTIFLADANALVIPHRHLVRLFDVINEAFELAPATLRGVPLSRWKKAHPGGIVGVYSFIDAFTGKRKTRAEFAELVSRGLRRVYIGLESGHEPLLHFLRKPSMPQDVIDLVQEAKAADVHVGIIVMLGIGGDRYAQGHVDDTIAVIRRLDLGADDIVYFSEFVDEPGSEYSAQARMAGIRPLTRDEIHSQARAMRNGFHLPDATKISVYDIREFIY